ncbi:phytoene desaturase family protein [Herbiconiux sp. YIM B11900]|uniref:phytoene desaturase family protein n=1 Tax=Herbiconiux sp. YIM B11900 TaxID=3404131 RepID=UPI003F85604A
MTDPDVVVVGSGPNGLAAAVTMARAGLSVRVHEGQATIGGGSRTAETTLPGFRHDVCSAVHPLALASGFFRRFGLAERIELIVPEASYGHPLDTEPAAVAYRDLDRTVEDLGVDGAAWRSLMGPLAEHADEVAQFTGSTLLRLPAHPITAARFGLRSLEQGSPLWNLRFRGVRAPALLSGVAAHSIQPMPSLGTAGAALSLGTYAHSRGWAIPRGGSQAIVEALADDLLAHGGEILTESPVASLRELGSPRAVLLDTSAAGLARLAADRLPARYLAALRRFRFGNAVAKVDYALSGPVPWSDPALAQAGTVHVGGTREAIAASEADVAAGRHPHDPYVLVSQPSGFDPSRAPEGQHVLWAYTHVPADSPLDRTEAITRQIERFAPGFRDLVLASSSRTAIDLENHNPNYVGGDIAGGAATFGQLIRRPTLSLNPWATPAEGVYLCSSSTPPGPGVHGLAGWYAARRALAKEFGITIPPSLAP